MNMSGSDSSLDGAAETLLITLYVRALESQRPDALIQDEKAVALVAGMDYDFSRVASVRMDEHDKTVLILRNLEFDRRVRDFLAREPQAIVAHVGCGLDSRFERVDDGSVEWFDLDLPDVISLREKLLGEEGPRHHLFAGSVADHAWMEAVAALGRRPLLVMAEGVFMYLEEEQVRSLVLALLGRFPGTELVFDTYRPFMVWANNLRMRRSDLSARYHFGLRRGEDVESWGAGIRLLDQWFPLDSPEPRLDSIRWARFIRPLARVIGIYAYRLGETIP
jgi:O-methyltransferase involved in polyketide biosynthesis